MIADKGYAADYLIEQIEASGAVSVIPARANRKQARFYDAHLYRERHVVEYFINIKHYRRIFSRFDKLAQCYPGFLHFAATLVWLR